MFELFCESVVVVSASIAKYFKEFFLLPAGVNNPATSMMEIAMIMLKICESSSYHQFQQYNGLISRTKVIIRITSITGQWKTILTVWAAFFGFTFLWITAVR